MPSLVPRQAGPTGPAAEIELELVRSYRLPRELVWLYAIAPVVDGLSILFNTSEPSAALVARTFVASAVPFATIPAACHAAYASPLPRSIARIDSGARRMLAHAALTTTIAVVIGTSIWPLHVTLALDTLPLVEWLIRCAVFTNMFILPTVFIQDLRAHARALEQRVRAERQTALEAQVRALQARTHPHFLFNTINTVASLIPVDPALAERTLERLADILRFSLESAEHRTVPLAREMEIIRDYLELHQVRFGGRLRWSIDTDPAVDHVAVPPLILQPLVENAVLHGVSDRTEGVAVQIRSATEGTDLVLEVADDGPGPGGSAHRGTQTSLRDLATRLELIYGDRALVEAGVAPGGGFRIRIQIPTSFAPR